MPGTKDIKIVAVILALLAALISACSLDTLPRADAVYTRSEAI